MTVPRHEIYNSGEKGLFHCVSRCVRRAFLCGNDPYSGKSFTHRREWIRSRLSFLAEIFTIEIVSYAIMENHLHTNLRTRPDLATELSDEEVARRWRLLFPLRRKQGAAATPNEDEISAIAGNKERVDKYRKRLSNLSWFNRCLNEDIARRANKEDECTGRFWQGRFSSRRIEDTCGSIACSVYVDLNPIRAGIAPTPEASDFTSIQDRILAVASTDQLPKRHQYQSLPPPLISIEDATDGMMSTPEYILLVEETGRALVAGKARIHPALLPILERLKINPDTWLDTARHLGKDHGRIVGRAESIRGAAKAAGKRCFHGIGAAERAFL